MILYLVRWNDLSASLVAARDEEHLKYLLDEVGDPGFASWEEYEGPLWLDFGLPFPMSVEGRDDGLWLDSNEPLDLSKVRFEIPEDDTELDELLDMSDDLLRVHLGGVDTRLKMLQALLGRLYPSFSKLLNEIEDLRFHEDGGLPPVPELRERLRASLLGELESLVRYSTERLAVERACPDMAMFGVTVPVGGMGPNPGNGDDPDVMN